MADPSKDQGGSSKEVDKTAEALKNTKIEGVQELLRKNLAGGGAEEQRDMSKHKFWGTQPVPRYDEASASQDGPIEPEDLEKVRKTPYPLIDGFEWVVVDMQDSKEVQDVYDLLYNNYVEDDEAMFRFKYSEPFLNWALKSPGWRKEWHIGIRASQSRKLVAFISAVPITLRVRSKPVKCAEVNFLCVHKKLRSKRLAPVLIREITRRCNLVGIWQAIYTAGTYLPTPVSTCRYFHRSLDWEKLYAVGFSPLPPGSTPQKQIIKYRLPSKPSTPGLRPLTAADLPSVASLLKRYLDKTNMAQDFDEEELKHWMLGTEESPDDQVIFAYVVEKGGKVTDFVSFYRLESTVIGNKQHDTLRVAYLFYYATEAAFGAEAAYRKRLNELVNSALILAKNAKFDVFNALTLLDNPLFLQEQKFGAGDGQLHYYLYNYRTAAIPGGVDDKNSLDETKMKGVGMVML